MTQATAEAETLGLATVRGVDTLRAALRPWREAGESLATVPTMGGLHEGHLELVRRARRDYDRVVATLFVNPMQFDRAEDLTDYPRNEASDAAALQALGVDLLYAPAVKVMYPDGFATKVSVEGLTDCLCGLTRPGHMDGVATVVCKLFMQIQPDAAYFGEKDYQQLLVVQRMVADLDMRVKIVPVETVREADGLALSSRNQGLTLERRAMAPTLHRVLLDLKARLQDRDALAAPFLSEGRNRLHEAGFDPIDYLELRAEGTLASLDRADRPARLFAAAYLGSIRLIDNIPLA